MHFTMFKPPVDFFFNQEHQCFCRIKIVLICYYAILHVRIFFLMKGVILFFSFSPFFRACPEGTAGPSSSPPPPLPQTWVPSSSQWVSEGEGGRGALSLAEETLQEKKNNHDKIQPGLAERLSIFRTSLYSTGMSTGFSSSSGNFIKALTVNRRPRP